MAFRDPVAYLVIKIWVKSKLSKIFLQPKIGLMKTKKPKGPIDTKISPKGETQNLAQTSKKIWTCRQSCSSMLFMQHYFDWPYLPHFNSEL